MVSGVVTRRAALGLMAGFGIAAIGGSIRQTLAAEERLIAVDGEVDSPAELTAADLAALPQTEVSGAWSDADDGAPYTATGPLLHDVIVASKPRLEARSLARMAVVVTGADGYQAVFSWAEIAPEGSDVPVVLALEFNGAPLEEGFQPAWAVSPNDNVSLRSVFGVARIELRDLGAGMATPSA